MKNVAADELAARFADPAALAAMTYVQESHPHDLTGSTETMSVSFLDNGARRLYGRLGFTDDRPQGLRDCVRVTTVASA